MYTDYEEEKYELSITARLSMYAASVVSLLAFGILFW